MTNSLVDLQEALPPGIRISIVKGTIRYVVRTSRNGVKYSLGTFFSADDAIQALQDFKFGRYKDAASKVAQIKTAMSEETNKLYRSILENAAPHELSADSDFVCVLEDGTAIKIPKLFVQEYLSDYYNKLMQESEE